jgi:hypothetical protein
VNNTKLRRAEIERDVARVEHEPLEKEWLTYAAKAEELNQTALKQMSQLSE